MTGVSSTPVTLVAESTAATALAPSVRRLARNQKAAMARAAYTLSEYGSEKKNE